MNGGRSGAPGPRRSAGRKGDGRRAAPSGRGRQTAGSGRGAAGGQGDHGARRGTAGSRRSSPGDRRGSGGRAAGTAGARSGGAGPRTPRPDGLGGDHVEGRQAVRELLAAGRRRVREVLIAEDLPPSPVIAEIVDLCGDRKVPVREVPDRRLEAAARTESPQGVVARAEPVRPADLDDLLVRPAPAGGGPFLVALDGVTDPGNLGAILRSAEVAGASGAILPSHRAVRLTPATVKAAAGAVEHLPIALVGGLPAALLRMREQGLWIAGLDGDGDAGLDDLDPASEPMVLVLGAEGRGLGRLVADRCDLLVAIPQAGRLDSLNVSAAAAVACTEVLRRRRAASRSGR